MIIPTSGSSHINGGRREVVQARGRRSQFGASDDEDARETALKEQFNLREIGGLSDDDEENEEKESHMEENRW